MKVNEYFDHLDKTLPNSLSSTDIVELGFFKSRNHLYKMKGDHENYLPCTLFGDRYVFYKKDLIKWLKNFYVGAK